jgi:hypothetical protein
MTPADMHGQRLRLRPVRRKLSMVTAGRCLIGWSRLESLWAKATARTSQFASQLALTSSFATPASRRTGLHGLPSWLRPQLMVHVLVTYW